MPRESTAKEAGVKAAPTKGGNGWLTKRRVRKRAHGKGPTTTQGKSARLNHKTATT